MAWKAGYKTKICTKPTDFWNSLLTSLTSPSFWKYTLSFLQLLSSHHGCFQISILSTDFLILFIDNSHTFTLSITIIMLVYHLKATKLHCISIGRHNTRARNSTAKYFSKSIQVLLLQWPVRNQCSVGIRWMLCSPRSLPSKHMFPGRQVSVHGSVLMSLHFRACNS